MRAREVTPEQAPELHGMIDRLCALADMPKPRVGVADTRHAQRVRDRPLARALRGLRDHRHPRHAHRRGARGRAGPRAVARRPPRRAGDDAWPRRRASSPGCSPAARAGAASALRRRAQQQRRRCRSGRWCRPGQPRRLRRQLRAAPAAVALPRAGRRPGGRLPDDAAAGARLGAAEDHRRDQPAIPQRDLRQVSAGHERLLHRPGDRRRLAQDADLDPPVAGAAARAAGPDPGRARPAAGSDARRVVGLWDAITGRTPAQARQPRRALPGARARRSRCRPRPGCTPTGDGSVCFRVGRRCRRSTRPRTTWSRCLRGRRGAAASRSDQHDGFGFTWLRRAPRPTSPTTSAGCAPTCTRSTPRWRPRASAPGCCAR